MLYKYRDLTNLQYVLDIFVNARMYAAPFEQLNDPMEGSYRYDKGLLSQGQVERIYGEKNQWHLLSLSRAYDNLLMWSHYAAGHTGIAVGVDVVDQNAEVAPVDYVEDLDIDGDGEDLAKYILSRKLRLWTYEEEYRVFKRNHKGKKAKTFVAVSIRELIFGVNADAALRRMITAIAKRFCPDICVRSIRRAELKTR